jgi:hypothetical protein
VRGARAKALRRHSLAVVRTIPPRKLRRLARGGSLLRRFWLTLRRWVGRPITEQVTVHANPRRGYRLFKRAWKRGEIQRMPRPRSQRPPSPRRLEV